ncbi:MAG: LysM peptidoglycan-binding domain-containing protein [Rhodobiaceae bacterium]|nr:LysM peptidoglycan-binding domain-containing protein [Rhodobiaceae bacterium]MCC0052790.1 LysM peptidoglycan-binding domain-containing protein [Rhodobiaceae bacterium]
MRSVFSESGERKFANVAAVSLVALAVAACSTDTTRFSQAGFSSSNDYTGSITPKEGVGYGGAQPGAYGAPQASVQQAPIAAPGSYPSQPYPSQPYPAPQYQQPMGQGGYSQAPTYNGGAYSDGSPGSVSSVRAVPRPAASHVDPSGTVVTVESGETLYSISRRYGVPVNALMQANGISDPATVKAGQRLAIPRYSATQANWVVGAQPVAATPRPQPVAVSTPQPVAAARPTSSVATATRVDRAPAATPVTTGTISTAANAGMHTVASGETLYSISRRYGVTVEALGAHNGISSPSQIKVGQRLAIPGAGRVSAAPQPARVQTVAVAPAPQPVTVQPQAQPQPIYNQPAPQEQPVRTAAIPAPQAINEGFRWPVRGRVINAFGERNNGGNNDGINIAVPEGTSVRAAENGVVIYAGSELEGLGNLVLVRHADDWVTAYAHNSGLKVSRGDKVTRGQVIALAGQTGKVNSPQLHFELRKGSKPVDPLRYLSAL